MDTVGRSNSPTPEEVGLHYASGYEARRHETGGGKLDAARTQELMRRFLPPPPALVRDVGADQEVTLAGWPERVMKFTC